MHNTARVAMARHGMAWERYHLRKVAGILAIHAKRADCQVWARFNQKTIQGPPFTFHLGKHHGRQIAAARGG
jgi:hypothetical protein